MAEWKEGTEQVVDTAIGWLNGYFDMLRERYPEMSDLEAMHRRYEREPWEEE